MLAEAENERMHLMFFIEIAKKVSAVNLKILSLGAKVSENVFFYLFCPVFILFVYINIIYNILYIKI